MTDLDTLCEQLWIFIYCSSTAHRTAIRFGLRYLRFAFQKNMCVPGSEARRVSFCKSGAVIIYIKRTVTDLIDS